MTFAKGKRSKMGTEGCEEINFSQFSASGFGFVYCLKRNGEVVVDSSKQTNIILKCINSNSIFFMRMGEKI